MTTRKRTRRKRPEAEQEAEAEAAAVNNEQVPKATTPPPLPTAVQFPLLGPVETDTPQPTHSYSSTWLHDPVCVSADLSPEHRTPIADFDACLGTDLTTQLRADGIDSLFAIQSVVIPALLQPAVLEHRVPPRDVCIASPTGSGKTLVFVLPVIAALRGRLVPRLRALVLLPTQLLAQQVYDCFVHYCKHTSLKCLLLGAATVERERQRLWRTSSTGQLVCDGADIVVSAVGRLQQHLRYFDVDNAQAARSLDLSQLRFLIVDEADRLMNDERTDWSSQLLSAVYESPFALPGAARVAPSAGTFRATQQAASNPLQKIFVSASLAYDTETLRRWSLFHPQLFAAVSDVAAVEHLDAVDMEQVVLPVGLDQYTYTLEDIRKAPLAVFAFIQAMKLHKVVCFVDHKKDVELLATLLGLLLGDTMPVLSCVTSMYASALKKTLAKFNRQPSGVLVSSDVACRGMQFDCVDAVVNYRQPTAVKQYVHRAGRTARASRAGHVLTICHGEKCKKTLVDMLTENSLAGSLNELNVDLDEFTPQYKEALQSMKRMQKEKIKLWKQKKKEKLAERQQAGKGSNAKQNNAQKKTPWKNQPTKQDRKSTRNVKAK